MFVNYTTLVIPQGFLTHLFSPSATGDNRIHQGHTKSSPEKTTPKDEEGSDMQLGQTLTKIFQLPHDGTLNCSKL